MTDELDRYPEMLADMRLQLDRQLRALGLSDADASRIAHNTAEHIRHDWGGCKAYIPKGREYESRQLRYSIVCDFTGNNKRELSRKYGLSEERIRQILADDHRKRGSNHKRR